MSSDSLSAADIRADFVSRLADIAEAIGWQAGVGGAETAGMIISYLAAHPEQIETVLEHGIIDLPGDLWAAGRLTWMGMNGQVVNPQQASFARVIRKMQKGHP